MRRSAGAAAVVLGLGYPAAVLGQAVCSAPHSSPVLTAGGTIETLPPGAGWIQVSAYRQVSEDFFNSVAERQAFPANGFVRTHSVYLTGAVGLARGVDLWAQVPVHDVRSGGAGDVRERFGVGDVRTSVRVSPAVAGVMGSSIALRAGVKLPGGEFPVDATIVPLSEGQRDWEVSVEAGRGFSGSLYALGWVGRRWREANGGLSRKPGDEWFAHGAAGGAWRGVRAELAVELLLGGAPEFFGIALTSGQRRMVQLQPTVGYGVGPGSLDVTALVPLRGRNLPAGPGVSVGYRVSWPGR